MIIGWVLAAISITGAIFNMLMNRWGFVIWFVGNTGWIVFNIYTETYEQIPIWIVYNFTCIYGFIHWTRKNKNDR